MQNQFIPTQDFQKLLSLITDLMSHELGLEMAIVLGQAGREEN